MDVLLLILGVFCLFGSVIFGSICYAAAKIQDCREKNDLDQ